MKIGFMSREFTKPEQYMLTMSPSIKSVKDLADGDTITVKGYLEYTDINQKDGTESEMLSILGENNEVWSCQSATFKRNFKDIAEIYGDEPFTIRKLSGTTNAGRDFVNCDLVI